MKKFVLLLIAFSTVFVFEAKAQYGFGTASPNPSAIVDMSSTTKGVLIPRVALTGSTDASTIANGNVTSLIVYNTATAGDVTPGFYYWNGTKWLRIVDDNSTVPFDLITSGTNTSAAMLVGSGASLAPTGTGTVTANIFAAGTGSTAAVDLNSDEVAGNLPIGNIAPGSNNYVLTTNATGATTWGLITNDNVSATAAIAVTKLVAGTDGQVLLNNGGTNAWGTLAASNVSYDNSTSGLTATNVQSAIDEIDGNIDDLSSLTSGHIYVGNASDVATDVAMSGDVTIDNTGATTISNDAVTTAKILDGAVTTAKIAESTTADDVLLTPHTVGDPQWGKIADANISSTAEIAVSKLANGTAGQILTTDGADVSWGSVSGLMADLTFGAGLATYNDTYDGSAAKTISVKLNGTTLLNDASGAGISLNLANANTWTGTQTFDVSSGNAAVFADAIDVQGNIANSGGDVTVNDNLDVTGNAVITGILSFDGAGPQIDAFTTTVADPGLDTRVPTEKAVRAAIDDASLEAEPFITFQTSTNLTNERVITAGAGINIAMVSGNDGSATISIPTDGVVTTMITDANVTGAKLAAAVAGDGLVQNASGNLDVNVDDATIEVASDVVQVKDDGITAAKINSNVAGKGLVQNASSGALETQTAAIKTITSNYTATTSDGTILVDASGGAVTITLPAAASSSGLKLTIKKIDNSSNNVSVGTVDGTTKTWNVQWQGYIVQSDGSNWYVVGIL